VAHWWRLLGESAPGLLLRCTHIAKMRAPDVHQMAVRTSRAHAQIKQSGTQRGCEDAGAKTPSVYMGQCGVFVGVGLDNEVAERKR